MDLDGLHEADVEDGQSELEGTKVAGAGFDLLAAGRAGGRTIGDTLNRG